MKRVITLLSDFGLKDPFAAQMKGVMLKINDDVNLIDITHDISPHLIREAAVTIGMCYDHFPIASVHVCVVDPGVGSGRRPIIVATDDHYFVGPDNGVFSYIYNVSKDLQVIHITADHYFEKKDIPLALEAHEDLGAIGDQVRQLLDRARRPMMPLPVEAFGLRQSDAGG